MDEDLFKVDLMYFLIGIVDAQLFKAVGVKDFKPIYIQQFYQLDLFLILMGFVQFFIEFLNNPLEKSFVYRFRHWVSPLNALFGI